MSLGARIFRSDRTCLLLIVSLSLLLFSTHLGGRDLWAPDEPRAGTITRHIVESGSWSALQDNGRAYLEKPPLFFWLGAAFSLPSGRVNEFTLRLPSSLAALLCVVTLFHLGRAMHGRRTGALAAIVLALSQDFFLEARWAHPDMLLCLCLTLSCLALYRAVESGTPRRWMLVAYGAIGFAILTKGPAGLLPLAGFVVFLAATRNLRFLQSAGLWWGIPAILLPVAGWLVAYRMTTGVGFPLGETLARVATRVATGVHHPEPLTRILVSLPIAFLPWTLLLPGAIAHTFPRRPSREREAVFAYSFLLVDGLFFALSAEKRTVYLLPMLPLISILVGRVWDTALQDWRPSPVERTLRWGLAGGLVLALGSLVYVPLAAGRAAPDLHVIAIVLTGVVTLAAASALVAQVRYGGGAALTVLVAGLVAAYLIVAVVVMPAVNRHKSARSLSDRIAVAAVGAPLGIYPDYHAAYAFYSGRRLHVVDGAPELAAFLRSAPRTYCLVEQDHFEAVRSTLHPAPRVIDRGDVGHRTMLLIEGGAPAEGAPAGGDSG